MVEIKSFFPIWNHQRSKPKKISIFTFFPCLQVAIPPLSLSPRSFRWKRPSPVSSPSRSSFSFLFPSLPPLLYPSSSSIPLFLTSLFTAMDNELRRSHDDQKQSATRETPATTPGSRQSAAVSAKRVYQWQPGVVAPFLLFHSCSPPFFSCLFGRTIEQQQPPAVESYKAACKSKQHSHEDDKFQQPTALRQQQTRAASARFECSKRAQGGPWQIRTCFSLFNYWLSSKNYLVFVYDFLIWSSIIVVNLLLSINIKTLWAFALYTLVISYLGWSKFLIILPSFYYIFVFLIDCY